MGKRVLVTGALGFIGRYTTKKLREDGYEVIATDIAIRDYSDYIRADVTSFEDLYNIFSKNDVDTVIHMAGEVGRIVGELYPNKMIYVNDIGTLNIARLCLEFDCKLLYFSTSEVYGKLFDKNYHVKEEDLELVATPFITTNIYAMSKLFGEVIIKHFVDNYGLKAISIRPFMVYGPGEYPSKYRSAITNFVHRAICGEKIYVHKGAMRAWCYISDFVNGVMTVMKRIEPKKYEAFNIGSEEYHSMEDVAKMVLSKLGESSNQVEIIDPPKKFLSISKKFSIDKIKRLGYSPQVSLEEGIEKVIQWQRNIINNNTSTDYVP